MGVLFLPPNLCQIKAKKMKKLIWLFILPLFIISSREKGPLIEDQFPDNIVSLKHNTQRHERYCPLDCGPPSLSQGSPVRLQCVSLISPKIHSFGYCQSTSEAALK